MRTLALIFLFALTATACSSTPSMKEEDAKLAEATDQCLAHPELAKAWGECNVKTVIFQRKEGIGQCQAKYALKKDETMMLKIRLRPNGRVRNVWAEEGAPKNKDLERCLAKQISRLKFAAPPKGVSPVIYFPFQP